MTEIHGSSHQQNIPWELGAQVGSNLFFIPPQINSCPLLFVVQLPHAGPMKPQASSLVAPSWPPSTVSSHCHHHSPVYTIPCPVLPLTSQSASSHNPSPLLASPPLLRSSFPILT